MNNFLHGPQPINDFIKFHNAHHIYYCEIIIYPNGDIEYCIPSHQETLLRACNMSKKEFMENAFTCNDIIVELCNKSKCIAVWYDLYVNPITVTQEQIDSLIALKNNNCIDSTLLITTEQGYQSNKVR